MPRRGVQSPGFVAARIAGIYAIFSIIWIVYSDRFVSSVASTQEQLTFLQTIKGGGFVVVSSVILFGLVYREHRDQVDINAELQSALQQVHILHRILRHDLRNICMIIGGKVEQLESDSPSSKSKTYEALQRQNERLIKLSRKSRYLRHFLTGRAGGTQRYDLVEIVQSTVDGTREKYGNARLHVEAPASARVVAHHLIDQAIGELIENAVVHNPSSEPNVWVSLELGESLVKLTVEDDGPGIPPRELSTLLAMDETPLEHSQGLGLWLVQLTTLESDGEFEIRTSEHGGALTQIELPSEPSPE